MSPPSPPLRAVVLLCGSLLADAAPAWYDGIESIHVFSPGDDVQGFSWKLYTNQTSTGQFSSQRYAFLLLPGTYRDQIAVGYYTSLAGVGETPEDVTVDSFFTLDNPKVGNACDNFWRSAEGLTTTTTQDLTWAASQAAPLRRVHIRGALTLSEEGPGTHWSSGGFLADSVVDGALKMGTQQQYLVRNTNVSGGVVGHSMNYVYVGVYGAPAASSPDGRISVAPRTPIVAGKPYLVATKPPPRHTDGGGGGGGGGGTATAAEWEWSIVVPPLVRDTRGPIGSRAPPPARIAMADVHVARAGDSSAAISAAIQGKRALLLTPGVYYWESPLRLATAGFVVLGLGYPTLVTTGGREALVVAAAGVRVAAVLLEAGTRVGGGATAPLLRWAGGAGVGSDVSSRVGAFGHDAPTKPACQPTRADVHVAIDGDDAVLDNTWLWHADHDDCGGRSDASVSRHGLLVDGARVTAYGLKAEHTFDDLVLWRGERGRVFMFQSELPYHDKPFAGVGYRVAPTVRTHAALGVGVYVIGSLYRVPVGIRLPPTANATNLFVWAIANTHERFGAVVCAGAGDDRNATCYKGDTCDYSSCYQLALPPAAPGPRAGADA